VEKVPWIHEVWELYGRGILNFFL